MTTTLDKATVEDVEEAPEWNIGVPTRTMQQLMASSPCSLAEGNFGLLLKPKCIGEMREACLHFCIAPLCIFDLALLHIMLYNLFLCQKGKFYRRFLPPPFLVDIEKVKKIRTDFLNV